MSWSVWTRVLSDSRRYFLLFSFLHFEATSKEHSAWYLVVLFPPSSLVFSVQLRYNQDDIAMKLRERDIFDVCYDPGGRWKGHA